MSAHGVYALTAILLVVSEWRAVQNIKNARPEDHGHFRKIHTSVLVSTLILVATSTAVWIFANFFYTYKPYVQGWILGLTDHAVAPASVADVPLLVQQIAPEDFEMELYQNRKILDPSGRNGRYDLGWVLLPRQNVPAVVLTFQHHYEALRDGNPAVNPMGIAQAIAKDEITIQRRLRLDLHAIKYSPGTSIRLRYEAGPNLKTVGTIFLIGSDGTPTPLKWDDGTDRPSPVSPGRTSARLLSWLEAPLLAQSKTSESKVFDAQGQYDPQIGRLLRERLGSQDLTTQLSARRVLVDSRSRSFTFIRESVEKKSESGYDAGLMTHNLAAALDEISKTGTPVPRDLYLQLATAFAERADYRAAATYFERAGPHPADTDDTLFTRAYAYSETDQFQKSNQDYEAYLARAKRPRAVAVTDSNIGLNYARQGRFDDAVRYYRMAMQKDDSYAAPFNNLAYEYAKRGDNLTEAMSLVDRALRSEQNNPHFKDTKAWVLYRMGRTTEALPLVQEAAAAAPNNAEIQEHVQVIKRANSVPTKKH